MNLSKLYFEMSPFFRNPARGAVDYRGDSRRPPAETTTGFDSLFVVFVRQACTVVNIMELVGSVCRIPACLCRHVFLLRGDHVAHFSFESAFELPRFVDAAK